MLQTGPMIDPLGATLPLENFVRVVSREASDSTMVVTAAITSLPPFPSLQSFKFHPIKSPNQSSLSMPTTNFIRRRVIPPHTAVNRPISAAPNGGFLLSEANPPENTDQIVGTIAADNGDGVSVVISVLLSIAFVGLSVLTIGVRYCKPSLN